MIESTACTVHVHDIAITIRAPSPAVLAEIWPHLAAWRPQAAGSRPDVELTILTAESNLSDPDRLRGWRYALLQGPTPLAFAHDAPGLLLQFQGWLDGLIVARRGRFTPVHAAVVSHAGRGIVIPAVSRAGKSTLCAALVRAGATYLSDELALLDDRGWVHPYARPLLMRDAGDVQRAVPPAALGADVARAAVPVALMLFVRYAPMEGLALTRLPSSAAVLLLARYLMIPLEAPIRPGPALLRAADEAASYEGTRGEADVVAAEVLALAELAAREARHGG